MYAILYWDIEGSRIEGPYINVLDAKTAAEAALREGHAENAGVFEMVDFLTVPPPAADAEERGDA